GPRVLSIVVRVLRALAGRELRLHDLSVAVYRLPHIGDPLPAVELDLGEIGPFEEVGEELDELVALRWRPRGPVTRQRAPRGLFEVEDAVRDPPDLDPSLPGSALSLQLRVVKDSIDLDAQLIRGLTGSRGTRGGAPRAPGGEHPTAPTQCCHRVLLPPVGGDVRRLSCHPLPGGASP